MVTREGHEGPKEKMEKMESWKSWKSWKKLASGPIDTTSSASRSPTWMDGQRADGAGAALTSSKPGDM